MANEQPQSEFTPAQVMELTEEVPTFMSVCSDAINQLPDKEKAEYLAKALALSEQIVDLLNAGKVPPVIAGPAIFGALLAIMDTAKAVWRAQEARGYDARGPIEDTYKLGKFRKYTARAAAAGGQ
jgi:hypothetical protein